MDRIRFMYENMPDHIRAGVRVYNQGNDFVLIMVLVLFLAQLLQNSARGLSISLLYADEFACVPKYRRTIFTSIMPTLATGGSMIMSSTPNPIRIFLPKYGAGHVINTDEMAILYYREKVKWFFRNQSHMECSS